MQSGLTYLDNATFTLQKPTVVKDALLFAMDSAGWRLGRLQDSAAGWVTGARASVARLLGAPAPECIRFTSNATDALNTAILRTLRPGDHVVTTSVEHTAVMRPLQYLERMGARLTTVRCGPDGRVDPDDVRRALAPGARMLVATHASNVLGAVQPIADLGRLAHDAGALFLVDAAQTAGFLPIDLRATPVDMLAFTGHKALLGPEGTGGLYVRPGLELMSPVGSGAGPGADNSEQPEIAPSAYEYATLNVPSLAGLAATTEYLLARGCERVCAHGRALVKRFLEGLRDIPGVTVYGPSDPAERIGLVALNLDGISPQALEQTLGDQYGIRVRAGLHDSPAAHRTCGTHPTGSVRFSFSLMTPASDVDLVLLALEEIGIHRTVRNQ